MKYIILLIFLSSCAQFHVVEMGEITQKPKNQLNCEPAESDGCAGWYPQE
jgi:hypothetical protein